MTKTVLLKEIKARLEAAYQERLKGVVLYGSEARGDARPDSDIDLLVLLEGPVELGRDLDKNIEALYPLELESGRVLSAKPRSATDYEEIDCPLHRSAHAEGIYL
jgi:uncharacterized protein